MYDTITMYTDGACKNNPGIGGWGVYLINKNNEKKINGYEENTTNNRMELIAIIQGLSLVKDMKNNKTNNVVIDLYSDSKYVIDGINNWINNWQKNNWKTANKKTVKNKTLWEKLYVLKSELTINWHWVKGHSNNVGNDIADLLANQAIEKYLSR